MSTSELPIHVQMLMALRSQTQARQRKHEAKTGEGLGDLEYQRHVGRIAECKVQIELINEMMRADLDEVSDFLENEESERDRETQRPPKGHRAGQRSATATAHHGRGGR